MPQKSQSLADRTFRWTFTDGPTAGKTYEHVFKSDGTVEFREVQAGSGNEAAPGKSTAQPKPSSGTAPATKYASFEVAPRTHLVSYLSKTGYTLTVAMNLDTLRCFGFASNDQEWYPITGTAEVVK